MKHLLNNLSQEEKNRILEQHNGGKKIVIENFNKLLDNKLGTVKPLISEQKTGADVVLCFKTNVKMEMDSLPACSKIGYNVINNVSISQDNINGCVEQIKIVDNEIEATDLDFKLNEFLQCLKPGYKEIDFTQAEYFKQG